MLFYCLEPSSHVCVLVTLQGAAHLSLPRSKDLKWAPHAARSCLTSFFFFNTLIINNNSGFLFVCRLSSFSLCDMISSMEAGALAAPGSWSRAGPGRSSAPACGGQEAEPRSSTTLVIYRSCHPHFTDVDPESRDSSWMP